MILDYCRRSVVVAAVLVLGLVTTASAATKKYKVRVDSAPPGAQVFVDNQNGTPVGVTPWDGSLAKGSHTLYLVLDGYELATKSMKVVRSRKVQEVFIPLTKKSDPPKIDIRADADPNVYNAHVFLDGDAQGDAPTILTTTTEGKHQIELKKDGYQPFSTWVTTKNDTTVTLAPVLKPIDKPKNGTIIVSADVKDADVYIDGNKVGTTPYVAHDVLEGTHVVEVRKEPAIPWKQTVQVTANQETKVEGELQATINGQGGTVRVLSNVEGAHAFLDGTDMGAVPVDIKDVKPGEHIVDVKAPGFQDREEKVTVNSGSSAILKLDLNKNAKASAKLKVVSPVPDADVYIDGASVGKVPVDADVSAGEHYVVVQLEGYKKFEVKTRVDDGQTRTVSAELKAVGKLRVLSDPPGATVLINGIPQDKPTPLELDEVEVGDTFIRLEMSGHDPYEEKVTIVGGKQAVLSHTLELTGMSPQAKSDEQRGLSSFGARTLPRGRSTIDLGLGYPYFGEIRVNVGASKQGNFGFDAGVGVRSFGARSELGLGTRIQLVNADPFTAGVFSDLWWGSKLLDNSGRNGLTWNVGGLASLTALTHVTITGRAYFNVWSDRHCPSISSTNEYSDMTAKPINSCEDYRRDVLVMGKMPDANETRMQLLTGNTGAAMFDRDNGVRFMTSIIAEVATKQQWTLWFMLEGAPFQGERALYTDLFNAPMLQSDYRTYARMGMTYKF